MAVEIAVDAELMRRSPIAASRPASPVALNALNGADVFSRKYSSCDFSQKPFSICSLVGICPAAGFGSFVANRITRESPAPFSSKLLQPRLVLSAAASLARASKRSTVGIAGINSYGFLLDIRGALASSRASRRFQPLLVVFEFLDSAGR